MRGRAPLLRNLKGGLLRGGHSFFANLSLVSQSQIQQGRHTAQHDAVDGQDKGQYHGQPGLSPDQKLLRPRPSPNRNDYDNPHQKGNAQGDEVGGAVLQHTDNIFHFISDHVVASLTGFLTVPHKP